jgi:hypothetical protein
MRKTFMLAPLMSLLLLATLACAGRRNATMEQGTLIVVARLTLAGATRPISQETLYLLDADPIRLAMHEAETNDSTQAQTHQAHPRLKILAGLMNGRRFSAYPLGPDIALMLEQSKPIWERHVLRTARTDDDGRAVFAPLAPGRYWLMCLAERDGKLAYWDSLHIVAKEPQTVVLDERNALTVSDAPVARSS